MLAIDDAHVADDASMRALLYTAQRSEDLSLMIVVTTRPRPALGGGDALAALATHPLVRRRQLVPLSAGATTEIVRAALPGAEDAFCTACWQVTRGNPFFTRELVAEVEVAALQPTAANADAVRDLGPTTIQRATAGRLERLAPARRRSRGPWRCWATTPRSRRRRRWPASARRRRARPPTSWPPPTC